MLAFSKVNVGAMDTAIFIHGGPGLRDYLRPQFEEQIPQSFFYDQASDSSCIKDYVDELASIVDRFSEVHLVGHSWGGVVALEYLKTRMPNSVLSLTLISVPLSFHCEEDFAEACKEKNLTNPSLEQIFLSSSEQNSEEIKKELKRIFANFNGHAMTQIASYFQMFDHFGFLQNCTFPVQGIGGSEDLRVPFVKQQAHAEKLKFPFYEVVGAGHFPFLFSKDSQYVADLLMRFFKNHKNPRP